MLLFLPVSSRHLLRFFLLLRLSSIVLQHLLHFLLLPLHLLVLQLQLLFLLPSLSSATNVASAAFTAYATSSDSPSALFTSTTPPNITFSVECQFLLFLLHLIFSFTSCAGFQHLLLNSFLLHSLPLFFLSIFEHLLLLLLLLLLLHLDHRDFLLIFQHLLVLPFLTLPYLVISQECVLDYEENFKYTPNELCS